MKILLLLLVLVCATPTLAADISGNVTLASTYDFRGMTQTNQEPAIQGGFDVVTDSGFYIGTWASNIAFDGSVEIDLYAGRTVGALEYTDWEIIYSQSFPSFDAFVSYGETSGDVEEDGVTVGISKSL